VTLKKKNLRNQGDLARTKHIFIRQGPFFWSETD